MGRVLAQYLTQTRRSVHSRHRASAKLIVQTPRVADEHALSRHRLQTPILYYSRDLAHSF